MERTDRGVGKAVCDLRAIIAVTALLLVAAPVSACCPGVHDSDLVSPWEV